MNVPDRLTSLTGFVLIFLRDKRLFRVLDIEYPTHIRLTQDPQFSVVLEVGRGDLDLEPQAFEKRTRCQKCRVLDKPQPMLP